MKKALTLKQALNTACPFRDKALAQEPMTNYRSTEGGLHGMPLAFWSAWNLPDRPRRIALLMDDCQEEYRPYAEGILANLQTLVDVFRKKKTTEDGVCIAWSSWSRQFDDGISNAMDRWYGPRGLRVEAPENAAYIFTGEAGLQPLKEIAPTAQEIEEGWFYHGKHLDMFWTFNDDGTSYLDEKLKALDIDTIVIAGLWTDECVLATAYAGSSRGYDVVVVSDAVATATANHEMALTVANSTVANVISTAEVVKYMTHEFTTGQRKAVKGTAHPDGRKT